MSKIRQGGEYGKCRHCCQVILGRRDLEKHEDKCRRTGYPLAQARRRHGRRKTMRGSVGRTRAS